MRSEQYILRVPVKLDRADEDKKKNTTVSIDPVLAAAALAVATLDDPKDDLSRDKQLQRLVQQEADKILSGHYEPEISEGRSLSRAIQIALLLKIVSAAAGEALAEQIKAAIKAAITTSHQQHSRRRR